jgi:hypothetical protein
MKELLYEIKKKFKQTTEKDFTSKNPMTDDKDIFFLLIYKTLFY